MKSPLVSIIIPTYNSAAYLGHAITSVLQQNYKLFEIVVIDDGSTDNTAEVIASFGIHTRINISYYQQENGGPSASRI